MAESAELYFSANAKEVVQAINGIQGRLRKLEKNGGAANGGMQRGFEQSATSAGALQTALAGISFAGVVAGAMKAYGAVKEMAAGMVRAAAEVETFETRFEVMLGSAEAAQQHVAKLTDFAAATPFDMAGISQASATLLAFGVEAQDSMKVLSMLGDVAAGSGAELSELARIYGKVVTAGKLDTADINQLGDRGLNVRQILAARDGLSMDAVRKNISGGKYGEADLRYVLQQATGSGGIFSGAMAKRSKTFEGMISTMHDSLKSMAATLGKEMLPSLKQMVDWGTKLVEGFVEPVRRGFIDFGELAKGTLGVLTEWVKPVELLVWGLNQSLEPLREMYRLEHDIQRLEEERAQMSLEKRAQTDFDRLALQQERERARLANNRADMEERAAAAAERAARAAKAEREMRQALSWKLWEERTARKEQWEKTLFAGQSAEGMRAELAYRYQQATGERWGGSLSESAMQKAENEAARKVDKKALAELAVLREMQGVWERQRDREIDERNKREAELESVRRHEIDEAAIYEARSRGDLGEVQRLEAERAADAKYNELLGLGMSSGEAAQTAAAFAGRQFGSNGGSSPGEWLRDDLAAVGGGGSAVRIPSAQLQVMKQQLNAANLTNNLLERLLQRAPSLPVTM